MAEFRLTANRQIRERNRARHAGNAVTVTGDGMTFTYQVATDNARLGDDVAGLRKAVASDTLLRRAMNTLRAKVSVLAYSQ